MAMLQATTDPHIGHLILGIVALLAVGALYLLPTIIAARRGHHQTAPIVVINVVFGWTLLGWVAALAWAVSAVRA
jgi:hypothetical protein